MPHIVVKSREGEERRLDSPAGVSVMHVMRDGGIYELLALCGGVCSCATCHVYIDDAFAKTLPSMSADENDLLEGTSHRKSTSRLSCQIPLSAEMDGLRLTIAPED